MLYDDKFDYFAKKEMRREFSSYRSDEARNLGLYGDGFDAPNKNDGKPSKKDKTRNALVRKFGAMTSAERLAYIQRLEGEIQKCRNLENTDYLANHSEEILRKSAEVGVASSLIALSMSPHKDMAYVPAYGLMGASTALGAISLECSIKEHLNGKKLAKYLKELEVCREVEGLDKMEEMAR